MARKLNVEKLSDEAGVYMLAITCGACGNERVAEPHALGTLCGWDATLESVEKRMRCSKCGKKQCKLRAEAPPRRPR